jgi:hypothetical protein
VSNISSGQQQIGLTRVAIDGVSTNPYRLHLHNNDNTKALFVGNSDVTISNGMKMDGGMVLEFIVSPNSQLYVVSDSGSHPISWLRIDV